MELTNVNTQRGKAERKNQSFELITIYICNYKQTVYKCNS